MRLFLSLCLTVLLIVVPSFAQVPIQTTGNLLVGASYNTDLGSSDQVLVLQLEANGTILVDEGHAVKFFFNQSDRNLAGVSDWMMPGFDDSDWEDGENGVGYNSSQTTAVLDTDDQGAIFSRFARFDIPDAGSVATMTIRADYDDSFIAWLNGVEIVRANIGSDDAAPEWNHGAVSKESTNLPGPNPDRWNATVSNLSGAGDDNPDGTIVVFEFNVSFDPTSVEATGKLTTSWGHLKASY